MPRVRQLDAAIGMLDLVGGFQAILPGEDEIMIDG
jgi:hypothetical protein